MKDDDEKNAGFGTGPEGPVMWYSDIDWFHNPRLLKDHAPITTAELIAAEYDRLKALSLAKNKAYGDSALHPVGIFSHLPASEAIRARIDDKLARHKCAPGALGENEIDDLIGYLVLLNIATRMEAQNV